MSERRLAGIPSRDAMSDATRQALGGIAVVAILIAAIVASILLSPTIPLGQ